MIELKIVFLESKQATTPTYTLINEQLSWNNAAKHCESLGQKLAVPRNKEQQKLIFDIGSPTRSWIGISDLDKEGNWVDVNGVPVTYTAFNKNEPNGNRGENCVNLYHNQDDNTYSSWNDDNCSELKNFICEKGMHIRGMHIRDGTGRKNESNFFYLI